MNEAARITTCRWRSLDDASREHFSLVETSAKIIARGAVAARGHGLFYELECDAAWGVRALDVADTAGRRLGLRRSPAGEWRDAAGVPLARLAGCVDIDLSATPFTNTLPLRRLGLLAAGAPVELSMAYVDAATLEATADRQRYTPLSARSFRYEAIDGDFTAEVVVDADGLVLSYPPLFERLA